MSITHTFTRSYKDQSANSMTDVDIVIGNSEDNIDDSIAGSTTNHQIHWAATRANLQSLVFSSDSAITIYTNNPSGSSPQDTIPLVAGQVNGWVLATDGLSHCQISADVTTIYVTNSNSGAATFKLRAVKNQ